MGRIYSVSACGSVASAIDLAEIKTSATQPVLLHFAYAGQNTSTTSTQARVTINRMGASGTGGTEQTPYAIDGGDAAFSGSVYMFHTTRGTPASVIHSETFNILSGWVYMPTPEMRQRISSSPSIINIGLETNTSDDLDFSVTVYIEEIG